MRIPFIALAIFGIAATTAVADDWPQWLGPQRDGVWRETGILDKFPEGRPEGALAHADRRRLRRPGRRRRQGLRHRSRPLADGAEDPDNPFAEDVAGQRTRPVPRRGDRQDPLEARVSLPLPDQLSAPARAPRRSSPAARSTPSARWATCSASTRKTGNARLVEELPEGLRGRTSRMWGFAGHPLIDGDKLICLVGGKGSVVVAFDKDTGKELWQTLSAPTSPATLRR